MASRAPAGRGYRQDLRASAGQFGLFDPVAEAPRAPEEDLRALIGAHFGTDEFSIEDAELFALTETGFRETHVRTMALTPAFDAGELVVTSQAARRRGTFPPGTTMPFANRS